MKLLYLTIVLSVMNCAQFQTREFQLTVEIMLDATPNQKVEVWMPIPRSNPSQTISNFKIDTHLNYELKSDPVHHNTYLYVHEENGIDAKETIHFTCDVIRKEHGSLIQLDGSNENYVSSNSQVPVGGVFSEIIDTHTLNKSNMRAVYDFVLNGMHYGKPKSKEDIYYQSPWLYADSTYGLEGVHRDTIVSLYQKAKKENSNYTFGNGNSLYACNIGVGNCTDYHSYFMSLGRTLGVPVRFHMGFPIPELPSGKISGYHCWADFYTENEGWTPVDISEADKHPEKEDYYFGTICENRIEMSVGRDIVLEGYEENPVNFLIYPRVEIDDVNAKSFTYKISYKNL